MAPFLTVMHIESETQWKSHWCDDILADTDIDADPEAEAEIRTEWWCQTVAGVDEDSEWRNKEHDRDGEKLYEGLACGKLLPFKRILILKIGKKNCINALRKS